MAPDGRTNRCPAAARHSFSKRPGRPYRAGESTRRRRTTSGSGWRRHCVSLPKSLRTCRSTCKQRWARQPAIFSTPIWVCSTTGNWSNASAKKSCTSRSTPNGPPNRRFASLPRRCHRRTTPIFANAPPLRRRQQARVAQKRSAQGDCPNQSSMQSRCMLSPQLAECRRTRLLGAIQDQQQTAHRITGAGLSLPLLERIRHATPGTRRILLRAGKRQTGPCIACHSIGEHDPVPAFELDRSPSISGQVARTTCSMIFHDSRPTANNPAWLQTGSLHVRSCRCGCRDLAQTLP